MKKPGDFEKWLIGMERDNDINMRGDFDHWQTLKYFAQETRCLLQIIRRQDEALKLYADSKNYKLWDGEIIMESKGEQAREARSDVKKIIIHYITTRSE